MRAVGRAGRGRLAPAGGGLRAVQRAVLRSFAATGQAPAAQALDEAAAPYGADARAVLAELAREDFLTLDASGRIRAAYPFSATPTPHRVAIAGGAEVHAMCAIDALGIPPMLGADARIASADPWTGAAVTVMFRGGAASWQPAGAVVFAARQPCDGPAAEITCGYINFFAAAATAREWADAHPQLTGGLYGQAEAERIGLEVFGALLGG
jgi:alkylmercury lyase-like protein